MFNRRHFLAGATLAGLAAPAVLHAEGGIFREFPFSLGVAAGDPASDGFVIWTRLAPEPMERHGGMPLANFPVDWEVASDSGFRDVVAKGPNSHAPNSRTASMSRSRGSSPTGPIITVSPRAASAALRGRARTLPAPGAKADALKFGVAGCQHFEAGFFGAYRHLAREDLAFVYHYGDFIYEYSEEYLFNTGLPTRPVRKHAFRALVDVNDFRNAYAQQLGDIDLQAARSVHAFLSSFDDHEIRNDWVSDIDNWKLGLDVNDPEAASPEVFMLKKQAAMQAWYEHMPCAQGAAPRGGMVAMNREFRWGDLMAMQLLDTRQYRGDQPCDDGFKPACPGVYDKNAQVLGKAQEEWLGRNLAKGGATWNAFAQQVTMMSLDRRRKDDEPKKILNLDSWAGYEAPRERILARMAGAQEQCRSHRRRASEFLRRPRPQGQGGRRRIRRDLDLVGRRRQRPAQRHRYLSEAQPRTQIRQRPARLCRVRRQSRGVADALHGRRQGDDAGKHAVEARDGRRRARRRGDQDGLRCRRAVTYAP